MLAYIANCKGDFHMRSKWSVTSDYNLHEQIKKLSEKTRIPVSKLLDEAIEDLLKKHDFVNESEEKKNPTK